MRNVWPKERPVTNMEDVIATHISMSVALSLSCGTPRLIIRDGLGEWLFVEFKKDKVGQFFLDAPTHSGNTGGEYASVYARTGIDTKSLKDAIVELLGCDTYIFLDQETVKEL